ncbi:nucleotidyl transferase AbiEii/AbiGii toxin family protein, partial [Oribacterium sinus]
MYAFGLLEAITTVGMPFVFKGGTSLMLLLEHPLRLSTDIDIIVKPGTNVNEYIEKASKIFPFASFEEQRRVGKNNIEKRHFKFIYESPINHRNIYILLDIIFEEPGYSKIIERPIKSGLIKVEEPQLQVLVPSVECILGDKLTAFAPHTIGVLLHANKDMEIIKQFYDVLTLIDVVEDYSLVRETYYRLAPNEIAYRGIDITPEDALMDTFMTAASISSRGKIEKEDYTF